MNDLIAQGRIVQPSPGAVPRYKRYINEMPGVPIQNLWDDIFPINSQAQERLGYSGVDGHVYFVDDTSGKAKKIVAQVKSGHVKAGDIRDLKGVMEREKAAIGCFITLEEPTAPMTKEALSAGFYESALKFEGTKVEKFPRIQILTIAELLAGKQLQYPRHRVETFKEAQRLSKAKREQTGLFEDEPF
jgi:site-specific DNA-methyltransferase (adenine-specific)